MPAADRPPYRTFTVCMIFMNLPFLQTWRYTASQNASFIGKNAQPTFETLSVCRSSLLNLPPFPLLPASTSSSSSSLMITTVCQTPSRIRGEQACESGNQARRAMLALVDKSCELCFSNWTWSKLRSRNLESRRLAFVWAISTCKIVAKSWHSRL